MLLMFDCKGEARELRCGAAPRAGGIFFRFMPTHAENDAVKNDEIRRQEYYAGNGRILPRRYVKVR